MTTFYKISVWWKENLNSDHQQFYQYQQKPIISDTVSPNTKIEPQHWSMSWLMTGEYMAGKGWSWNVGKICFVAAPTTTTKKILLIWVKVMAFNVSFNNISVISWRSVLLLVKTTDLPEVTEKVYHIMLHQSTSRHGWDSNSQL